MATVEESSRATAKTDTAWTETFLDLVTPYLPLMVVGLSLLVVFTLINLVAIWNLSSSSPGGAVAIFSIGFDLFGILLLAPLIYFCRRHEKRKFDR